MATTMARADATPSMLNFQEVTDLSAEQVIEKKMKTLNESATNDIAKMTDLELAGFTRLYGRYMRERAKKKQIDWDLIQPPSEQMLRNYSTLEDPTNEAELLGKLAVVKLNGGLGTSMGCTGPKSVIEVRGETTFLDLTVQQIETLNNNHPEADVPLLLMNSFNTDSDTAKIIQKYQNTNVTITTFQQSRYPRIIKDSLEPMPVKHTGYSVDDWYPPGHGDFFESFYNSGLVDTLISQGKEYVFVSNVDNLGATVDLKLLKAIDDHKAEYLMELTDKTRADIKGGTLINYEGKSTLLEVAQVPSQYLEEFKSIKKFKVFNTNNVWISLKAIKRIMSSGGMELDIIANSKSVGGEKVIQLETAIGAAIAQFENSCGVNVPRSRFLPVKSCSDLMLIQSNLYNMKSGTLVTNPMRMFSSVPVIKLGPEFKKVSAYLSRFSSIPDIVELDHLTVSGDVQFGAGVVLKGTVIIVANPGSKVMIPDGAVLENKVITGNLHILDH
uniref:UTP--glucose-1-phosphate uridylyltransferase n=1 Tax=Compsopogon caeruleus TaxID=31354 RepID=A0A7S1XC97_9RHOD|mmetsp:Transcript_14021/g.28706  ORF Transcript_14021/g.28706 Transcript_14021/m.28706 type:complete len:499 (+) Transcript_14021:96-1592(+)